MNSDMDLKQIHCVSPRDGSLQNDHASQMPASPLDHRAVSRDQLRALVHELVEGG
jgi:hypothetical protein